jgi:Family of unknown function (DUF6220)
VERPQNAQRVLGWIMVLGATLQFFLAGLAVFHGKVGAGDKLFKSSSFDVHKVVGDALVLVAFAILVLAIVNRDQIRLATVLFALMVLQYLLAGLGENAPVLGALHPVNGVAIIAIAHFIARGPRGRVAEPAGAEPEPAPPTRSTPAPG